MSNRKTIVVGLIALATLTSPLSAFAQDRSAPATTKPDDYGYVFPDDPLDAGLFGPNDVHIRVLPKPKRSVLIRPRVQFVVEMLKSVEDL